MVKFKKAHSGKARQTRAPGATAKAGLATGQGRGHWRRRLPDHAVEGAYDPHRNMIDDPRHLNPYRGNIYSTLVQALLGSLGAGAEKLIGKLNARGDRIVSWGGELSTDWFTLAELSKMIRRVNPAALAQLAGRSDHDRIQQLNHDLTVLQRTGGQPQSRFATPLMQALMAIDSRWVIVGCRKVKQFRLAVGRGEPHKISKSEAIPLDEA